MIKKLFLLMVSVLPTMLYAQVNPKQGYVITNQNDTIYGTIDYLSDTKCAYECHFKADGETKYKIYQPADISAYRLADNGVFYVTKTFMVGHEEKTFFAEYLLQGGISLFYHREDDIDYFYFINQNGKVVSVMNDESDLAQTYENLINNKIHHKRADRKRAQLAEVGRFFGESQKAMHDLWVKDINARNLTQVTYDYNMEYCTSDGDCVVFRRDELTARSVVLKMRFQAGVGMGTNKLQGLISSYNNLTMHTVVPQIGAGVDFIFPRSSKHWSVQAMALMSRWSMSDDYYATNTDTHTTPVSLKYWKLGFQAGLAYNFKPKAKISPVLRGGAALDVFLNMTGKNLRQLYLSGGEYSNNSIEDYSTAAGPGFYVGAGVDVAIQKHVLRLTADYQWTHCPNHAMDISNLAITAGIRL